MPQIQSRAWFHIGFKFIAKLEFGTVFKFIAGLEFGTVFKFRAGLSAHQSRALVRHYFQVQSRA